MLENNSQERIIKVNQNNKNINEIIKIFFEYNKLFEIYRYQEVDISDLLYSYTNYILNVFYQDISIIRMIVKDNNHIEQEDLDVLEKLIDKWEEKV